MPSTRALLHEVSGDQLGIELSFVRRAALGPGEPKLEGISLDDGIISEFFIRAGEGRIGKENCVFSVEEILDLLTHIEKFCSGSENNFEWSSVEPTIQMLQIYREEKVAHIQLLLSLFGIPEGYSGNATITFQFDASDVALRAFHGEVKSQLLRLLNGDEKTLEILTKSLEEKLERIRRTSKRAPRPVP